MSAKDMSALKAKINHLQDTLAQQTADMSVMRSILQSSNATITELREAVTVGYDQLKTSKKEQSKTQKALIDAQDDNNMMIEKMAALHQVEIEKITAQAQTDRQQEIAQRETLEHNHTIAMEKITQERDCAKEESGQYLIDIAILGEEISTLHAQNSALQSQNELLSAQRQSEIAELGSLLQQKEQTSSELANRLNTTQAHQSVLNRLQRPHESLNRALSNRLAVRSYKAARTKLHSDTDIIAGSKLFDAEWYKATYPDIADQDPLAHFVQNGLYELRNPSPHFDSLKYHLANPDVTENETPALLHYIQFGKAEGRAAHPVG